MTGNIQKEFCRIDAVRYRDELLAVLADLRSVGCDILTIGQYLAPSPEHPPVVRFVPPEEFDELRAAAKTVGYAGIELHGLIGSDWTRDGAPFCRASAARTVRTLRDEGLTLACLDSVCDLSAPDETSGQELLACIRLAHDFSIPYVRVRAQDASEAGLARADALVRRVLPAAAERGVTLLVETAGAFSDTALLAGFLMRFSSDTLAALWDLHHPYFEHGESPETSIKNLGA